MIKATRARKMWLEDKVGSEEGMVGEEEGR